MRVYRYSDAGAPSGYIWQVLRACLVTGYGSQPPAGWSTPFSNATNDNWVFRQGASATGNLDDFKVYQSRSDVYVQAWDEATSFDTGNRSYYCAPLLLLVGSAVVGVPWVVLADERTVVFAEQSTASRKLLVFGDLDYSSAKVLRAGNSICLADSGVYEEFQPSPRFAWNGLNCAPPVLVYRDNNTRGVFRGMRHYRDTIVFSDFSPEFLIEHDQKVIVRYVNELYVLTP